MDDDALTRAAEHLSAAMAQRTRLKALPEECRPQSLGDAYAVQERFAPSFGGEPVGYKVGASNRGLQEGLGIDEPFWGRLMSARVFESPADIDSATGLGIAVESEYAFRMGADLPAGAAPFDREQVAAAVGVLVPAIEIVDTRFEDLSAVGGLHAIADNGLAGHWVPGVPVEAWRQADIVDHEVVIEINGEAAATGSGRNVLGHPLESLRWLANHLAGIGRGLEAGDYVTTGSCTKGIPAQPGDQVIANFGPLGQVSVAFTPL